MKKLLWSPSEQIKNNANMTHYIDFVNKSCSLDIKSYNELYVWSIDNIPDFWATIWDYVQIKASKMYDEIVDDLNKFPGTRWFKGARLNFGENLLRYRDNKTALIFRDETKKSIRMTYEELYNQVAKVVKSLRDIGIKPGDRVGAYMPNLMETVIAMLATTCIGASWASCATDLGVDATFDRLGQIEPKVLFTVDGYYYRGRTFNVLDKVEQIVKRIPSLERVVMVRYIEEYPDITQIPYVIYYDDFISKKINQIKFEQLDFNHPAVIMFSSGTTGKPKCLVQSAGGLLINHLKELILHNDLKREDVHFYITTCSWMMWNWLLSSLGVGATIVLFDGNPVYPELGVMWQIIQDEKISIFGTSATYINLIRREGLKPGRDYDLSSLRSISQTGSVLSDEGFEYIYDEVKKDLHFNSISGGTDINGCFAIGSPIQPVYAGELQGWGLGMKCKVYNEKGTPILDEMGELVCEAPSPSMPLYFWHDSNGEKYRNAYFNVYPDVWRHGDFVKINSTTGGVTFFGRSDAVLKPSGVRIGTSEIYNQVDAIEELVDSLAIGQEWKGDQRIILFVKLGSGKELTDELKQKVRSILRTRASPRHVPARIISVPDIPYTLNMKKVESAVTNIIHNRPVTNRDALRNPESLTYYEQILADLNFF
jgi:acetoacetyl-CoA synthetase